MSFEVLCHRMEGSTQVWTDNGRRRKRVRVMPDISIRKVFHEMVQFNYRDEKGVGHIVCLSKDAVESLSYKGFYVITSPDGKRIIMKSLAFISENNACIS